MRTLYLSLVLALLTVLNGCMPVIHPPGSKTGFAQLHDDFILSADGAKLPLRRWLPAGEPRAILIALHGFNDYSNFFAAPGAYLSSQGVACFAYDQRGFGAAPQRGFWAGIDAYGDDAQLLVTLLRQRYPQRPVFLLGESMGGAVVLSAMQSRNKPQVDGIILVAPAVWARSTMPWYQSSLLWTLAHTLPWLTLTGKNIKVQPSDNIAMLRALARDPLVIKETRVDTIYGLADLMDAAFASASTTPGKTLLLYGEKDDIIPKEPTFAFLQHLLAGGAAQKTVALYPRGHHMLLRDLQGRERWQDIAAWIGSQSTRLPSGADARAQQLLKAAVTGRQLAVQ